MKITYEDELQIITSPDNAIAHGCNTQGIMGVGAAYSIRMLYPASMFAEYRKLCLEKNFRVGDALVFDKNPDLPVLFNLGIQGKPGQRANLDYVQESLYEMAETLSQHDIKTISITPLGAVHGGLQKDEVIEVIDDVFKSRNGQITIYTNPKQKVFDPKKIRQNALMSKITSYL